MACPAPLAAGFPDPVAKAAAAAYASSTGVCPGRPWLTYAMLSDSANGTGSRPVVALYAGDLRVIDGCYGDASDLCQAYCTPAVYSAVGLDLVVWEIALSLLGLLGLLATLLLLCAPRQLPGGRLAAVHRQLLAAYSAHYACRSVRLLAWPAVRCLGRDACLSLDALGELLEIAAYSGLFASFLAQSICLRVRLGQPRPAFQSPPRRKRQPLYEFLSLVWPLPVAIATAHLACRTLAPGQLAQLHTFDALLRPRPVSYFTAFVRLPLGAAHLISMVLGLQSLRLSMRRRVKRGRRRLRGHRHRRRHHLFRWARTLALINALTGAYLLLDLLPPGLAGDWRALRSAQLAAHLLQSLLVTLPMFWLNRRLRRSAGQRIRRLLPLLHPPPPPLPSLTSSCCSRLGASANHGGGGSGSFSAGCRLVSFLEPGCDADRIGHVDCEIDS